MDQEMPGVNGKTISVRDMSCNSSQLSRILTPAGRWVILSMHLENFARRSGLTKTEFIRLFAGNSELERAAETWWDRLESSDHPYGRLWFRHWCCETRAHPKIRRTFQYAQQLGLIDNVNSEPFHLLRDLSGSVYRNPKNTGYPGFCCGDEIDLKEPGGSFVSWVRLSLDNADFTDEEVEEELERRLRSKKEKSLHDLGNVRDRSSPVLS